MTRDRVRTRTFPNTYRDSVELMQIAAEVEQIPGITRAGLVMGTLANLGVLRAAGLLSSEAERAAPNDLVVAVAAERPETADGALLRAAAMLADPAVERRWVTDDPRTATPAPTSLDAALAELPGANLAIISTPGPYATAEALKALKSGLDVFLFSDNVSVADEVELKRMARSRGRLLMGPDCGTAILDGIPLGFANAVRRGPVGIVAASGTGSQQVACLVDRLGSGISQAIGVGGRDLHDAVGGLMMAAALERLATDPGTGVVVIVAKPGSPAVERRLLASLAGYPKPIVACFLGADPAPAVAAGVLSAQTLEEAAVVAVARSVGLAPAQVTLEGVGGDLEAVAAREAMRLVPGQSVIRGLYTGGSLADEARLVIEGVIGGPACGITDFGTDEFTIGRPHPMIDPRLRNDAIVEAARDPSTAVVLLDVVLGYGAHPDPAGATVPAVLEARSVARAAGRHLAVVASVCGTEADPQGLRRQEDRLMEAGVRLAPSNARAARFAALVAGGVGARRRDDAFVGGT